MKKTKLLALSALAVAVSPAAMSAGFQLNEHSVSSIGRANAGAAAYIDNAAVLARNPAASTQFDKVALSVNLHVIDPNVDVEGTNRTADSVPTTVFGGTFLGGYTQATGVSRETALAELGAYQATGDISGFTDAAAAGAALQAADQASTSTAQAIQANPGGRYNQTANAKDVAPTAVVPGLYVAIPVDDKLAFGVSLNSYFGLSSDYGTSYAASEHANFTSVETIYLTPSVAYEVTDNISLGLGLQIIHGTGEIENNASPVFSNTAADFLNTTIPSGSTLLKLEGDGQGYGFQLGLLWELTDASNIGFRYQSEVSLELDGDINYLPLASAANPSGKGSGTLTVDLPQMVEIGYSNKVSDNWAIMGTVLWTGWSSFEALEADIDGYGTVTLKEENWNDVFQLSVGAEYDMTQSSILRFGVGYDESPVSDEYRTLTIPDADRLWLTAGSTVKVGNAGSIDLAVVYISGDEVEVSENSHAGNTEVTTFEGKLSSTDAVIFSLGYNHEF